MAEYEKLIKIFNFYVMHLLVYWTIIEKNI